MRSLLRGGLAVGSGALGIALACGHPVPPSGGPADETAPEVTSTSPALYETNVAPDRPLRIAFSEPMDKGAAEDGIVVRPHVAWSRRAWAGDTLVLAPRDGWASETTYVVLLRSLIADHHQNPMKEPASIVFSTGDATARGRIVGEVARINLPTGEVLVMAFSEPVKDTTQVDPLEATSVAEPDAAGRFLLPGLEVGRAYEVGAFLDANENRAFDSEADLYCRAPAPVAPDSAGGPSGVRIRLVYPDEPGRIVGFVADTTCRALASLTARLAARSDSIGARRDSLLIRRKTLLARADSLLGEAVAPGDSTAVPADSLRRSAAALTEEAGGLDIPDSLAIVAARQIPAAARADSVYCLGAIVARFRADRDTVVREERPPGVDGEFSISDVPPGAYRGLVWRDIDGDGAYTASREPGSVDSVSVWVAPGGDGVLDTLRIGRPVSFEREEP
jgi:hypothetical protein